MIRLHFTAEQIELMLRFRSDGMSYAAIGTFFSCSESAATNAIVLALAERDGARLARRDYTGAVTLQERDRMDRLFDAGAKNIEIQQWMGLSPGNVTHHRRRYEAARTREGKPFTAPGGDRIYPGRRLHPRTKEKIRRLVLEGMTRNAIGRACGCGNKAVDAIRRPIIAELRAKGECLPGCDINGHPIRPIPNSRWHSDAEKDQVRAMLKKGMTVAAIARELKTNRQWIDPIARQMLANTDQTERKAA